MSILISMSLIVFIIFAILKWIIPIMASNITEIVKVIPDIFDSVYKSLLDLIENYHMIYTIV